MCSQSTWQTGLAFMILAMACWTKGFIHICTWEPVSVSVCRSSPMDWKKTATGLDRNWKESICRQLVLTSCNRSLITSKNPCENALKTTIIWVFTCFLFFYITKLLHLIMFCAVYILYNIIPKIPIQNPSVLHVCVISHKNCCFRPFSPVNSLIFNRTWSKPVQTSPSRLRLLVAYF